MCFAGEWDYRNEDSSEDSEDEEEESGESDGEQYILIDEDADIDESCVSEEENAALQEVGFAITEAVVETSYSDFWGWSH